MRCAFVAAGKYPIHRDAVRRAFKAKLSLDGGSAERSGSIPKSTRGKAGLMHGVHDEEEDGGAHGA
jgi:hypothetical protein